MKRMFIVGRDEFLVTSMRMALKYTSELAAFGIRDAGSGVRRALRETQPDIVLLDGTDRREQTLERMAMVSEERPGATVIVLAAGLDSDVIEHLLAAGATVCLSRALNAAQFELLLAGTGEAEADDEPARPAPLPVPVAEVVAAAEPVATATSAPAQPSTPLTAREMEILRWVAEGHTNARIGRHLWVTEQTVKFHLSNIFRKLGVSNRTEASRYVLLNGPVPGPLAAEPVGAADSAPKSPAPRRTSPLSGRRRDAAETIR